MKKGCMLVVSVLVSMMMLAGTTDVSAHGEKRPVKKAVLLAAFGTTFAEARKGFENVEAKTKEAFPGVEVRWAYTSKIVRNKLASEGKVYDSVETALSKLMDDGFTHVAVLSLQTIPGEEFHQLVENAHLFGQMVGGFDKILVARPLLSSHEDMEKVGKAMLKNLPADRKPGDYVLLMGHGTEHHPADAIYLAVGQVFHDLDPQMYVGTVEGYPTVEDVAAKMDAKKSKKVYLMPFMAVAGDHAHNDMAGSEPDSWKSVLEKKGFACTPIMKGTVEYPEVIDIWIEHLKGVMAHLD
ncbi:MAG: sirohydrochlorin cobaltochelatase [Syntrophobacteraceae bacterium]